MSKSALLSYLPRKVSTKPDFKLFGNQLYAKYLPRVLDELGFAVDYIDWKDTTPQLKKYDLFMGHGGYNFVKNAHARTNIFFSTGFYWKTFNYLEAQRFTDLYMRKGVLLDADRKILVEEESALDVATGIITLGNEITAHSYIDAGFTNVYPIGGMTAQRGEILNKDYAQGSKHFMFYSGNGAVHKGLDLLIEAFAGTNLHLHICQRLPIPFLNAYPELDEPNIHVHGHIDILGDEFKELVALCDWVISATCCEGCPSSVLECMAHGLIPVVTKNASIKMDGCAYITSNIDEIRYIVKDLSMLDPGSIYTLSECSRTTAEDYYSPEAFSLRLKEAVKAIL